MSVYQRAFFRVPSRFPLTSKASLLRRLCGRNFAVYDRRIAPLIGRGGFTPTHCRLNLERPTVEIEPFRERRSAKRNPSNQLTNFNAASFPSSKSSQRAWFSQTCEPGTYCLFSDVLAV